jgi:hypothetical protein
MVYLLNMSETISTSVNAASIFSADESCGLLPNRNDMLREGMWSEEVQAAILVGWGSDTYMQKCVEKMRSATFY